MSDSRRISKKADFKSKIDKIDETLEYRRIVVGGSFDLSIYRFDAMEKSGMGSAF